MSGEYLSQSPSQVYVRPVRSIGGLTLDVIIEENHSDDVEITEHPVEAGAAITDHAYLKPSLVTVRGGQSDSSGKDGDSGERRSIEMYQALLKLRERREPFDLVTGKRTYKNMLIKSLSVTTDAESEHVLLCTAELQEVLLVSVQTVSVPRSRQRHGNKTGAVEKKGDKQLEPVQKSGPLQLFGGTGYRRSS